MAKKLVVGNWKLNPQSLKDAEILCKNIARETKDIKSADIVVCPPFALLSSLKAAKTKKIKLGAQDVSAESDGPHTGEVSAKMLASMKVSYVIVGHSERRAKGESDETVNAKITQALKAKLSPILCVGEQKRDLSGDYLEFIKKQLHVCLSGVGKAQMKSLVIAYEPIWAIGAAATRVATAEEFTEVKIYIRKVLSDMYDAKTAHATYILYGGSAHPENAASFIEAGADGFLEGRDSLNPKKFANIVRISK